MNPTTLKTAFTAAKSLWSSFQDYREQKELESYAELEKSASRLRPPRETQVGRVAADLKDRHELPRDTSLFPEARREAGKVTQAAHDRLERALAELNSRREAVQAGAATRFGEAKKEAEKAAKQAQRDRKKAGKGVKRGIGKQKDAAKAILPRSVKAAKQEARGKKASKFWPIAGVLALLSAIAGGVYYWLRSNDRPSENPPRVEEFGGNDNAQGSTLVYTSTSDSPELVKVPAAGPLAEDGVTERDEELFGSIDEQLARHRAEAEGAEGAADGAEAPHTNRVTDDHENEGKHRLQGDPEPGEPRA